MTLRQLSGSFLLLALLAAGTALAGSDFESEYLGGTILTIPRNTKGTLDLSDKSNLLFRYGSPSFQFPYASITSLELQDATEPRLGNRVGKVLPFIKRTVPVVTIGFRGPQGEQESLVLVITREAVGAALPVLESRSGIRVRAAGAKQEAETASDGYDRWWGDSFWRTNRNAHLWPDESKGQVSAKR